MREMKKSSRLREEHLDGTAYLETLLAEGERVGALTAADVARVQSGCLELLAENLEQKYGKHTSSVPEEYAEELLESLLYVLSLPLKGSPSADAALAMLTETPLPLLYNAGLRVGNILLRDVRVLAGAVRRSAVPCANPFYRRVTEQSLFAFTSGYKLCEKAHAHGFDPIYRLARPVRGVTGVEYVREYAKTLLFENYFCHRFPEDSLAQVLSASEAKSENLFCTVLLRASERLLTVGTLTSLHLTAEDRLICREVCSSTDADMLEHTLRMAFAETLGGRHPYLDGCLKSVAKELVLRGGKSAV